MQSNFNPNSGSHKDYAQAYSYSTPYNGGNNRSSVTEQTQYHSCQDALRFQGGQDQSQTTERLPYSPRGPWEHTPELSGHVDCPQSFSWNDLGRIRPEHEGPWTGQHTFSGLPLQQIPPSWSQGDHAYRAHSVAGGYLSHNAQPPVLWPNQSPHNASVDSGFESGRPTSSNDIASGLDNTLSFHRSSQRQKRRNAPPSLPKSTQSDSRLYESAATVKRRRIKAPPPVCEYCGKDDIKNQSDAMKHEAQHTRPYRCNNPGCNRRDGFATQNDLQRHRKSVHGASPTVGKQSGYMCQACPPPPQGSVAKWWPRLDNFKAHAKRKHPDRDREELAKLSETLKRPDHTVSESGYGSQMPASQALDDDFYQNEFASPLEILTSRHASCPSGIDVFSFDRDQLLNPLAEVGQVSFSDGLQGHRASLPGLYGSLASNIGNTLPLSYEGELPLLPPLDPISMRSMQPSQQNFYSPMDVAGYNEEKAMFDQIHATERRKAERSTGVTIQQHVQTDQPDKLSVYRKPNGHFDCPKCPTTWPRECDLRKHMKRHSRRYGCTFPNCYKRFGSRYDWNRHENSQHRLNEMWRCGIKLDEGCDCGTLCSSKDAFTTHLQRKHDLKPGSTEMDRCTKGFHLGEEGYDHFWCGFCNGLIKPDEGVQHDGIRPSAYVTRSLHIGEHFDKNKWHIEKWYCIEHKKPKGLISKEDQKKGKVRLKSKRCNDESELGEDGIPSSSLPEMPAPPYIEHDPAVSVQDSTKRKFGDGNIPAR